MDRVQVIALALVLSGGALMFWFVLAVALRAIEFRQALDRLEAQVRRAARAAGTRRLRPRAQRRRGC